MLTKIRESSNNLAIKILFGLIVLTFLATGIAAALSGFLGERDTRNNVVTFSKATSVSIGAFENEKRRLTRQIQDSHAGKMNKEMLNNLNLDGIAMKHLVQQSMLDYLAKIYDIKISDDRVNKHIRSEKAFFNKNGTFDYKIFDKSFSNPVMQKYYLNSVKKQYANIITTDIFANNITPPPAIQDYNLKFLAENREFDIISLNLLNKDKDYKAPEIDEATIKNFYDENIKLFTTPEARSFEYLKADKKILLSKLKITEAKLKVFFENNKDNFSNENYSKAKKEVRQQYEKEKLDYMLDELSKNLEDDISSGLTIAELSQKYNLNIKKHQNLGLAALNSSENSDLNQIASNIFELSEGEISDPIVYSDNHEIFIVGLSKISTAKEQELTEIQDKIKEFLIQKDIANKNVKKLQKFSQKYSPKQHSKEYLKNNGMGHATKKLIRSEINNQTALQPEMLMNMFDIGIGSPTNIYHSGKNIQFAYLKKNSVDTKTLAKLKKNLDKDFTKNSLREAVMQDLLSYLLRINDAKIHNLHKEK